jgi:hypothetical protein
MFSTIKSHRRAFRSLVMATLAVFELSACVQTAHKTTGTLKTGTENRRIVLMPVDIELSVLNAGGVTEPRADWTNAGRDHVRTALSTHTSAFEAEIVFPDNSDILGDLDKDQLQIVKLANAVGSLILLHEYLPQLKLPTKNDQFDWTIGPDARLLKVNTTRITRPASPAGGGAAPSPGRRTSRTTRRAARYACDTRNCACNICLSRKRSAGPKAGRRGRRAYRARQAPHPRSGSARRRHRCGVRQRGCAAGAPCCRVRRR